MASTTPNLGLRKWDSQSDLFSYTELANNWTLVDNHDHTSGKGVQIPTGGLTNAAVTNPKIANLAVDTGKIADTSVTGAKIAAGTLSYTHMGIDSAAPAAGCFSAYRSTTSAAAAGKITFNSVDWDLGGWYNSTTGLFTPQVRGVYLLTSTVTLDATLGSSAELAVHVYKNNAIYKAGPNWDSAFSAVPAAHISTLVTANGTTDTFQINLYFVSANTPNVLASSARSYFQGYLVAKRS